MGDHDRLPFYLDPGHPVGLVVLTVVAGVLLWALGQFASFASWLAVTLPVPLWLVVLAVLAVALLLRIVSRARREPVFSEGAVFKAGDVEYSHPYCMHCWEHGRKLISAKRFAPTEDVHGYQCVTHGYYEWGGDGTAQPAPSDTPAVGGSHRLKRSNF